MIIVNSSKIKNLTDKIVTVTSHPTGKTWTAQRGDLISIDLRDFPQADQNESVGQYRIDFAIEGEDQYGVCSLFTNWNQLYYSIQKDHYVASSERRLKGAYDGYTTALVPQGSVQLSNTVVNFQVTILDKKQIMVQANLETAQPSHA